MGVIRERAEEDDFAELETWRKAFKGLLHRLDRYLRKQSAQLRNGHLGGSGLTKVPLRAM